LQSEALAQNAGPLDDPSAGIGARRHRLAHGLRIIERAGFFDQLHGLGDRRILKRKGERSGIQRLPSRRARNYARGRFSSWGGPAMKNGAATGPVVPPPERQEGRCSADSCQRSPKKDRTATTTTTRPTM
jgi:hypothetical protein